MADCRIVGLAVAPLVVRAVVDLCTRGCCCVSVRRRMACLTRAESSSCSTGGTLASLYRAGSGVVFHTGKHPLRAWLTAFWIRLMECWRPVRTWRNCPPFLTNEDLVRPGYHTSEANRALGITTAFIAFVIAAGGAPECTLLSPRI